MDNLYKYDFFDENTRTILPGNESKDAFIIVASGGTAPSGYSDFSSITSWYQYGNTLCTDILQTRDRIKEIVNSGTWSGLTNNEKDIVIELYIKADDIDENTYNTNKVTYLMSNGYSLQQAQGRLIQAYGSYHTKEVIACTLRANCGRLYEVIAKYLSLADAGDLIKITHKLFDLYKSQAIRGTEDGNAGEGLFNFLESTVGSSYENAGLEQQGYVLKTGTYSEFITELMYVLRHGNY